MSEEILLLLAYHVYTGAASCGISIGTLYKSPRMGQQQGGNIHSSCGAVLSALITCLCATEELYSCVRERVVKAAVQAAIHGLCAN